MATARNPGHIFATAEGLTAPSTLPPRDIAVGYLRELAGDAAATLRVVREYRTAHNGVTHLVFRQQFDGIEVANAEVTVNIDAEGRVLNAGGSLAEPPAASLAAADAPAALAGVRAAAREVNPRLAERFTPFPRATGRGARYSASAFPDEIDAQSLWWEAHGTARPAWRFTITDEDGIQRYAVVVDQATRKVLSKRPLTLFQAPPAPRGLVFERGSPRPNPRPGALLTEPPPLVERTLQSFAGDAGASPRGWVEGNETAGNNVIVGSNLLGEACPPGPNCPSRPLTAVSPARDFSFPLEPENGLSPTAFENASTVNLFYWMNRSHDLFHQIGFDEAAGNFQRDNFGRGGVPGDPFYGYTLFGSAAPRFARTDNAFYGTYYAAPDDGTPAFLAFQIFPGRKSVLDASLDAEVIVHEYTHGVSSRLVRQLNDSYQGAAMGEGWSDFYAMEFLTPEGAPLDGAHNIGEYVSRNWGAGIRTRPYSTRLDVNPLTFAHLGRVVTGPEVHADGEIWAMALWEVRAALIRQLGEREGRRRARVLVLDGMKLAPPAPSMVDARDAILLADRAGFKGASQEAIWTAFARRGLGALAQASSGNAFHISPSSDPPSRAGALKFYDAAYTIGEPVRIVLHDANQETPAVLIELTGSSGDRERLTLRRKGLIYTGQIETGYAPIAHNDNILELVPGDYAAAYYVDPDTGAGARLVETSAPTTPDYYQVARSPFFGGFEGEQRLRLAGRDAYQLPFEFPFFGRNYALIWIHEYGLLTFEVPDFTPCADPFSLSYVRGIAPLFMDLTVQGTAQSGEDVYVSQGPDWVTFRWAGESVPPVAGVRPEPVNFAATLWRDGRIEFKYGSGNRNLTGGSPFFGCLASTPTVGISNGRGTYTQLAQTHTGRAVLENASRLIFDPPQYASSVPEGRLERPVPDETVQGVLTGSGVIWDNNPEGGIRRMDVLIDGIAYTDAALNVTRNDFCADNRVPRCPNVGFRFSVPLERWRIAAGDHTLQVRATNTRGAVTDLPERPMTFRVEPGQSRQPAGRIESPREGEEVGGRVVVQGWALANDLRVTSVDILVDGITYGRASYGANRPEVCAALATTPPNCPRVGFTFTLDTATGPLALSNGRHTLSARIQDEAGRLTVLPETVAFVVNNVENQAPRAVLLSPRPNDRLSGTVRIAGHAWDPDGRVTRVRLWVDDVPFPIDYGRPSPEACASLPDVPACPNIGFELELNTRLFQNGPHTLLLVVQDDRGAIVTVPANNPYGMNVFVEN